MAHLSANKLLRVLVAALAVAPLVLRAQDPATIGWVRSVTGTVTVQSEGTPPRVAGVDTELRRGDVVETEAGSTAAVRYRDGTEMQIGARSRMTVTQFVLLPQQPQEERFAARLLAGAMRVVTGAIGRRQPANASFSTSTATIGIRGTDFVVRVCEEDCISTDEPTVANLDRELVGRLGAYRGGVSAVDPRGRWRALSLSAPLREGDRIVTGSGVAILVLRDDTRVAMEPSSLLWVRGFRFDPAHPASGRMDLVLLRGKAQVATGTLAKLRPERFGFVAGESAVRVHGTLFGAAVRPGTASQFAVTQGAISVAAPEMPTTRLAAGEMLAGEGAAAAPQPGAMAFSAPPLAQLQVDAGSLFGAPVAAAGDRAAPGTYVHVRDGAVELAQDGGAVVLAQGETGFAAAAGGAPAKVGSGVRVAGLAGTGLARMATPQLCRADTVVAGAALPTTGRAVAPSSANLAGAQMSGRDFAGRMQVEGQDTGFTRGGGRSEEGGQQGGGGGLSGRSAQAFGIENGRAGVADQARGGGVQNAGQIGVGQANVVRGSDGDTFGGERVNNARGGGVMTQGGRVGRVGDQGGAGRVSSGNEDEEVIGNLEGDGERDIIGVTDDATSEAREERYAQTAGDHYAATKDMTFGQRAEYWRGERDRQLNGQGEPTGDDNFTAGGNGLPIFLRGGQFGIAIRGVERAVGARLGKAGGGGDGRGDAQDSGGGAGGGVAMSRDAQLGVTPEAQGGSLNIDAALKINQVVNPTRQ